MTAPLTVDVPDDPVLVPADLGEAPSTTAVDAGLVYRYLAGA